jgi:hypothetical protein
VFSQGAKSNLVTIWVKNPSLGDITLSRILWVVYFLFFNIVQQIRFCSSYYIVGDKKRSGEVHRRKNPSCVKKNKKNRPAVDKISSVGRRKKTFKKNTTAAALLTSHVY